MHRAIVHPGSARANVTNFEGTTKKWVAVNVSKFSRAVYHFRSFFSRGVSTFAQKISIPVFLGNPKISRCLLKIVAKKM